MPLTKTPSPKFRRKIRYWIERFYLTHFTRSQFENAVEGARVSLTPPGKTFIPRPVRSGGRRESTGKID
ncbi:hypothetical protein [Phormidium sp. CCY1219]|uniref:hypothetical protein n=1 Tax=Phormidium sp. CCY1219 TaxID=2886104 RepID=UPI002D1E6553|nr:hypothetical protein [Phormidium sp. CCY1219]MEB3830677.1 hypothetical protein [Phormidium sp. CCY1219]